jgi:hypothetical protein
MAVSGVGMTGKRCRIRIAPAIIGVWSTGAARCRAAHHAWYES